MRTTITLPRPVRGSLASTSAPGGVPYFRAVSAFVRCCSYTVGIRRRTHRRYSP